MDIIVLAYWDIMCLINAAAGFRELKTDRNVKS